MSLTSCFRAIGAIAIVTMIVLHASGYEMGTKKPASQLRTRRVVVLFTEYELSRLELLARQSNPLETVTISDYVRQCTLGEGKKQ